MFTFTIELTGYFRVVLLLVFISLLIYFMPMFSFYTPCKHQKTSLILLCFQGGYKEISNIKWAVLENNPRLRQHIDNNLQAQSSEAATRCSIGKGVLKHFAKFTGKHLYRSFFFNKVTGFSPQLY